MKTAGVLHWHCRKEFIQQHHSKEKQKKPHKFEILAAAKDVL